VLTHANLLTHARRMRTSAIVVTPLTSGCRGSSRHTHHAWRRAARSGPLELTAVAALNNAAKLQSMPMTDHNGVQKCEDDDVGD
jgi:hypothetical protein